MTSIPLEIRLAGIIIAIGFAGAVFELVRRRALLEKYAFTWIAVSGILLFLALFPGLLLERMTGLIGGSIPANILFLLGFVAVGAFLLRLTVHISNINERLTRVTQELAILKMNQEKIEESQK